VKNLRGLGINVNKGYERKRKILESEVTSEGATKGINIDDLTAIILSEEQRLNTDPTRLVVDSLISGHDVKIYGFGNFQIRTKAARPGRNPRTGELIPIDARRVATFHASHKLKALIQGDAVDDEGVETVGR
jgi:nucleoid DNA-binding protein